MQDNRSEKNIEIGGPRGTQGIRGLAAHAETISSVPSTRTGRLTTSCSSSSKTATPLASVDTLTHMPTHVETRKPRDTIKNNENKELLREHREST